MLQAPQKAHDIFILVGPILPTGWLLQPLSLVNAGKTWVLSLKPIYSIKS